VPTRDTTAAGEQFTLRSVIYVELLDDGVQCWRPVEATRISEGVFQLPPAIPGEVWAFEPESIVRAELRAIGSDPTVVTVAVEAVLDERA
jgi:hypothetical protein